MRRTMRTTLISIAALTATAAWATPEATAATSLVEQQSLYHAPPHAGTEAGSALPEPGMKQRVLLEERLSVYRAIAAAGGLPEVPGDLVLEKGEMHSAVLAIRRHLIATGDLTSTEPPIPGLYTRAVREAVERYQARHGLTVDGIFGPQTAEAMNVPVTERIKTLELNIDRLRSAEVQAASHRVEVNVAAQEMRYFRNGELVHTARVVVGKPSWQTPRFSDRMETVVLNPSWTVTRNIARSEILPKLREDPGYLASKNMVLYADWNASATVDPHSVDWSQVDGRSMPYMIRQRPGPGNALGQVKFLFPNEYAVYLHDTPSKSLFEKPVRAYSHGCMRLEDPLAFAKRILADVNGMSAAEVDRMVASETTRHVALDRPIAIDVVYRTAWVAEDGTLHFRPDIYDLDNTGTQVATGEPAPDAG